MRPALVLRTERPRRQPHRPRRRSAGTPYNTASYIGVTVECGLAESDPLPALTLLSTLGVPIATVRLDWAANFRLVDLLAAAASRFA
jgi:hypothetical protein